MTRSVLPLIALVVVVTTMGSDATAAGAGIPSNFIDPAGRFAIAVPPDARLLERDNGIPLTIRSATRGYAMTLQAGQAKPEVPLSGMAAKLEAANLGPTKRWLAKIGERSLTVAGLPALDAVYDGSGMRWRVVIVRGQVTDFVFMFMATPETFDRLTADFDWLLEGFRLTPMETAAGSAPAPPGPASASATPPDKKAGGPHAQQRFRDPELGFAITYPDVWTIERPSSHRVVFGGRAGSEDYLATVQVQNVRPDGATEPTGAARTVLADLRAKLANGASDLDYLGEGPIAYVRDGVRIEGHQVLMAYTSQGRRFQQWTVVMPRTAGTVIHVWSYAAPESRFAAWRPTAEAMFRSWTLETIAGAPVGLTYGPNNIP